MGYVKNSSKDEELILWAEKSESIQTVFKKGIIYYLH